VATPNTGYGIGDVITLLWFRWRYPRWAGEVLEMVIKTVADRGLAADEFIDYMAGRGNALRLFPRFRQKSL